MEGLIRFRKLRGLTQAELGEAVNSDGNSISRYERGMIKPSINVIKRLAEFFGISVEELLNGPAPNEVKFTIVWEVEKEMNAMEVRPNEFKIGFGAEEDFGCFSIPKDIDIEEIGRRFMDELKAARVGRKARDEELKKLNG
jgi:transcriptional regulator with XRE-family HTH domain